MSIKQLYYELLEKTDKAPADDGHADKAPADDGYGDNALATDTTSIIVDRETECKIYNDVIKSLDEAQRAQVGQCLYRLILRYQAEFGGTKGKSIAYKPKVMSTQIYIYNLEDLPERLADMLLLCLRDYIFGSLPI
jgi:hypothetical protein